MNELTVINLFAGPGVGKTVLAADLFSVMKKSGAEVEMASEYAKDMVYEQRTNILKDQLYVLGKQNRRLERLSGQVDFAICDSPLLLCPVYAATDYYPNSFKRFALDVFHGYNNINFYLRRSETSQYQAGGRTQKDLEEARTFDMKILAFLVDNKIEFQTMQAAEGMVDFNFVRRHILNRDAA